MTTPPVPPAVGEPPLTDAELGIPPGMHEAPAITAILNYVGVEGTAYVPDVPAAADHEHPGGYLSTACLHELHEPECGAAQRARGYVGHPTCKFCGAKCVCPCHIGQSVERAERVHVDGCTLAADDQHHAGWCVLSVGAVSGSGEATTTTDGQ